MARITVKVHPRAKRTDITGKLGDIYKMDVAAPPAQGRANEACVWFFAGFAGVPPAHVRILRGLTNRVKVIEIEGVSQEFLDDLLANL